MIDDFDFEKEKEKAINYAIDTASKANNSQTTYSSDNGPVPLLKSQNENTSNEPFGNLFGNLFGNIFGSGGSNFSAKMANLKFEDILLLGIFFLLIQEKEKCSELLIALGFLFFIGLE